MSCRRTAPVRPPLGRLTLGSALLLCALSGCAAPATGPWTTSTPASDHSPTGATVPATGSEASATITPALPVPTTCPASPATFVNRAPGEGKTVALTFDDGPAPADREIVPILARYGVHATFFLTGLHAAADPETVRLLADQGHLLGGHSWDHQYPSDVKGGWTIPYLNDQNQRTSTLLTQLSGQRICFYRPPGGYRQNVLTTTATAGLTPVLWSVDTNDWEQPGSASQAAVDAIVTEATKVGAQAHPVVLMHSGKASHEPDSQSSPFRGNTVAALPEIIEWYQAHGYTFVRMDGQA